ncbi:MAG: lysylphosphatidylglycerol synthase domain-containing protein, partial [Candidatus Binataceae bacterium]
MHLVRRQFVASGVTVIALAFALSRMSNGHALASAASSVSLLTVLAVVAAILAGNLLASLRLKLIAGDLNTRLSFRDSVSALTCGQLAGSFFFQVIGQTIARSAVLSPVGVSVPTVMVMTGYERIVAALISLGLAVVGGLFLFGRIVVDFAAGGADLALILAGVAVVAAAGAVTSWGGDARKLASVVSWDSLGRAGRVACISAAIQFLTMSAYIAATLSLHRAGLSLATMAAATSLVMLAASIPISLAGWGLREISAVYALGYIGIPTGQSLVIAIFIGATSLLVSAG